MSAVPMYFIFITKVIPILDNPWFVFFRDLSYGRVSSITGTLRGDLPTIEKRDPWDGKDAELPVEDDIDLSDVDLDDGKDEL